MGAVDVGGVLLRCGAVGIQAHEITVDGALGLGLEIGFRNRVAGEHDEPRGVEFARKVAHGFHPAHARRGVGGDFVGDTPRDDRRVVPIALDHFAVLRAKRRLQLGIVEVQVGRVSLAGLGDEQHPVSVGPVEGDGRHRVMREALKHEAGLFHQLQVAHDDVSRLVLPAAGIARVAVCAGETNGLPVQQQLGAAGLEAAQAEAHRVTRVARDGRARLIQHGSVELPKRHLVTVEGEGEFDAGGGAGGDLCFQGGGGERKPVFLPGDFGAHAHASGKRRRVSDPRLHAHRGRAGGEVGRGLDFLFRHIDRRTHEQIDLADDPTVVPPGQHLLLGSGPEGTRPAVVGADDEHIGLAGLEAARDVKLERRVAEVVRPEPFAIQPHAGATEDCAEGEPHVFAGGDGGGGEFQAIPACADEADEPGIV